MPLQPGDHPALIFLHRELLPFLIAGRQVKRQWFVRLDGIYRYTGDLAAALAGLGLGGPLVGAFAKAGAANPQSDLWTKLTTQLGPTWVYVGIASLAVWVVIRVVVQNEAVSQRATLARQFALDNEAANAKLYEALRKTVPRDGILEIYRVTMDRVQTALAKAIWPFDTFRPPALVFQAERDRLTGEIRESYMANWAEPPPGQEW